MTDFPIPVCSSDARAAVAINWLTAVTLGSILLSPPAAAEQSNADQFATDANIVTGLDISDSIDAETMRLEIDGLARAVQSPEVLRAIRAGTHRRIGFAVFAWYHNAFPVVVAWRVIASEADARAAAQDISARLAIDLEAESRRATTYYIGRLTDLSQAIDHAHKLLEAAPFAGARSVINIIGNGEDNVGEGAGSARDRFVAAGGTLNAVVLGTDQTAVAYYSREVAGGPGSFVMSTSESANMTLAMTRKFLHDIIAAQ